MPRLRDHSLSIFFLAIFLLALVGQSVAGLHVHNQEAVEHGSAAISYSRYLVSSDFGQAVLENWQSEFLQFTLFILATIWLLQRGSPESKALDEAGRESDEKQKVGKYAGPRSPRWARVGGMRTAIYSNSLLLLMASIFFATWATQSVTGWSKYNSEQQDHKEPAVSWSSYVTGADFWEDSLQNWQSEFLAVGSMAVFSIYLRQRGSPESKPVGASHEETGSTG